MDLLWFLAGVGATLVGFVCSALWDLFKWYRDSALQQKAFLTAAVDELKNNLRITERNNALLTQEISILGKQSVLLNPLSLLRIGAWNVIKIHHPNLLIKNNILAHVNSSTQLIGEINETVRSREMYRQNNGAMSNFADRMQKYDQMILEQNNKLIGMLKDLDSSIEKFVSYKNE